MALLVNDIKTKEGIWDIMATGAEVYRSYGYGYGYGGRHLKKKKRIKGRLQIKQSEFF